MTTDKNEIRAEIAEQVSSSIPDVALDALVRQVALMRDAAGRIETEGAVVLDAKGNASEHPCIRIEREAGKQVRDWLARYRRRQ